MSSERKADYTMRFFLGGVFILLGVGFILGNLNVFQFGEFFSKLWPVIIILFGLAQLISNPKAFWGPAIIILFGVLFLLGTLNIFTFSVWSLVGPLVLILVGFRILIGSTATRFQKGSSEDFSNLTAVFGASTVNVISQSYKGGVVTAIFGGSKIDLRAAKIADDGANIDVNVIFGGADVIVPKGMNVVTEGIPVFGGFENKAEVSTSGPRLTIKGLVAFGGVTIKNDDREDD